MGLTLQIYLHWLVLVIQERNRHMKRHEYHIMKHRVMINLHKQDPFKSISDKESYKKNRSSLYELFNPVSRTRSVRVGAVPSFRLHVVLYANATQVMYYIRQWCVK